MAQNLFRLDGKIAFVSGSRGHLGQAMARALAGAGAHVLVNGRDKVLFLHLRKSLGLHETDIVDQHIQALQAAKKCPALAGVMGIESGRFR